MISDIEFETRRKPCIEELVDFYHRQHHATTGVREKLQRMVDGTLCFVTARRHGELIGIARGVSDGLVGRLAECKLDSAYQGPACVTKKDGRIEHDMEGIAARMARLVIQALRDYEVDRIEVQAHGTEVDFCEDLGFRRVPGAMILELPVDAPVEKVSVTSTAGGA